MANPYPDKPGICRTFDDEAAEKMRTFFDSVVAPHLPGISEDVSEIETGELSAISAGMASSGDCAEKIQSRVSIWLSENR